MAYKTLPKNVRRCDLAWRRRGGATSQVWAGVAPNAPTTNHTPTRGHATAPRAGSKGSRRATSSQYALHSTARRQTFFLKVKRPCLSVTPLNDGGLASLPVSVCHWRQVDEVFGQQHMGSTNRETQQVRGRPPGRSRPLLLANVWLAAAAGKDGET